MNLWLTWRRRASDWISLLSLKLPQSAIRTGAMIMAAFCLFATPLHFLVLHHVPAAPDWPVYLSMVVSALVLGILAFSVSRTTITLSFLANVAVTSILDFVMYPYLAASSTHWFPFQAGKLLAIVASLTAPDFTIGIISIALAIGTALIRYHSFPPAIQAYLKPVEPWGLYGWGLAATCLALHRLRVWQLEMRAQAMQVEMESTRRLAQEFLQIRDLMNTPLQTIEIATTLLRRTRRDAKSNAILDQQQKSCARLKDLSRGLERYDHRLEWRESKG